jgi:hypothetical protein
LLCFVLLCFVSSLLTEDQEVRPEAECSTGIKNDFIAHGASSGIFFRTISDEILDGVISDEIQ